jgi:hypothetical protein
VQHPHLGLLEVDEKSARGALSIDGRKIPLRIGLDDKTFEEALSLATAIAGSLADYDQISKDIIAKNLLDSYNDGWNEYDEIQEDGSLKSVVDPKLSPAEFKRRFVLNGLDITGDRCVSLWYECGTLFWGHSVCVESLNGADFTNAMAQLFG